MNSENTFCTSALRSKWCALTVIQSSPGAIYQNTIVRRYLKSSWSWWRRELRLLKRRTNSWNTRFPNMAFLKEVFLVGTIHQFTGWFKMRKFALIITRWSKWRSPKIGKPLWAYSRAFLLDAMIVDGRSPLVMDITPAIRCVTMTFATTVLMSNLRGVYRPINLFIIRPRTENYAQTGKALTDHNQTLWSAMHVDSSSQFFRLGIFRVASIAILTSAQVVQCVRTGTCWQSRQGFQPDISRQVTEQFNVINAAG